MTEDGLAAYDALETKGSAIQVMGDEVILGIALELMDIVRSNVTVDETIRVNVQAKLRELVHCVLRRHWYTPHKQDRATQTVLEQAEVLSEGWGK